jgi:hypothetical protein
MKGKKRGPCKGKKLFLGSAIVAAIKRCELVCNPAVVRRPKFTIHVRRLSEGQTRSWLVSCVNSEALADGKENGNYDAQASGESTSSDHVATIHERNGVDERSSTRRSASQLRVLKTKTNEVPALNFATALQRTTK